MIIVFEYRMPEGGVCRPRGCMGGPKSGASRTNNPREGLRHVGLLARDGQTLVYWGSTITEIDPRAYQSP
ncbi:unnamed protein product [Protopolystoma xenopodis]|uniref:Uncharacterized protein n=1 Tax=Protopolystoma xenopodis TaxID=117903 RepID=A0A448X103_9PLAT|nr:unnamed protein product [Protopolystoma xenopodis]